MAETHHFDVSKLFTVKDWVCVVTGGGTGIGLMVRALPPPNGSRVCLWKLDKPPDDTMEAPQ